MLVNMNEVLYKAKEEKYGVGLFNAVTREMARGVMAAAQEEKSPIIIGTAEVLNSVVPLDVITSLLLPMAKNSPVPVVLHYDHGLTRECCIEALKLGFSSIMYDCSTEGFEENIKKVAEMAEIAHSYGATIEGELGHVGNNTDSKEGEETAVDMSAMYTDPAVAKEFVERTGVDALAIAVGTAHGSYKLKPKLDFDRIKEIAAAVNVPLVLHGGSGLTDEDFKKAIQCGISKINIFTDLNISGATAIKKAMDRGLMTLTDFAEPIIEGVKKETMIKMRIFDSVNRA